MDFEEVMALYLIGKKADEISGKNKMSVEDYKKAREKAKKEWQK